MKACVVTLGCKVNQFESSALLENLAAFGYSITDNPVDVDLVVLNTCTVTQKADKESLALLRRLKRENPRAKLVATGCLAQSNPELLAQAGLADLILGQDEKAELLAHLALENPGADKVMVGSLSGPAKNFGAPKPERTRAFYKIQDGCNVWCSYCAVPLSRGPSRSLGLEDVLLGLRSYLAQGVAEVVLCGIHLGHWGLDLTPQYNLTELMHIISSELEVSAENFRLRLSSLEPLEMTDELFMAYELYPWLARHLHLPLQSGSNEILKAMGRPYQTDNFADLIFKLKKDWPQMALGVDIMVGFPGETEKSFLATKDFLQQLPLSYFHVFPYSKRPGTKAAEMPGQVHEQDKKNRSLELKTLNWEKRKIFAKQNIGFNDLALVENTVHHPSGRLKILTGNYLYGLLPQDTNLAPGHLVPVTLSSFDEASNLFEAVLNE